MSLRLRNIFVCALLALGACAQEDDPEAAPSEYAASLAAGDATLVLDLVNYPGADRAVLDDDAGLDARAARNIDEHRAGADAVFPSGDDDRFDDIVELDDVPYVGDTAFQKLLDYARLHPAPAGETVEGIDFRGWEAEIVVWGVNRAALGTLDGMLDSRAAKNLIAARPFASVAQMGDVAYVGPSALDRLRGEAPVWWAARRGAGTGTTLAGTFDGVTFDEATAAKALEICNLASRDDMVSHGVYASGAAAITGNRPYTSLAAVAAVSGVGSATMRGIHDYAASGAWPPPPVTHTPPDPNCVFGLTYGDIFTSVSGTIVIAQRVLDPASDTNATQRAQIIAAVRSAYPDVSTVSAAFAAVDGNTINHTELWDASNRRAYTAYEFGAGDNSYGLIFDYGATTIAARDMDTDLYDCAALWGNEMRPCERSEDCAEGLTCYGTNPDTGTGRCLNLSAVDDAAAGSACSSDGGCPPGTGLVCAGATVGAGTCVPAWMRGTFGGDVSAAIPDGAAGGVTLSLPTYGLAPVTADVLLDLLVEHPRLSDVTISLIDPAGREVPVWNGATAGATGTELSLYHTVVRGMAGDGAVNGLWQVKVVDGVTGQAGEVARFGLTITTRND